MEASTALARDFPSVAALSREDWQTLLTESLDPVEHAEEVRFYEAILHQLPSVRLLYEAYEAQLRRMEQAAAVNEAQRPELKALRAETRAAYAHARTLEQQWPNVEHAMIEAHKRFTPQALCTRLRMAANEVHEASEDLANAYVEGLMPSMDVRQEPLTQDATFVRQYRALRVDYHHRALRAERAVREPGWPR